MAKKHLSKKQKIELKMKKEARADKSVLFKKMQVLIYMLNELDSGSAKIKEIAEEAEVSVRTIQRYIQELSFSGLPITSVKPGEYKFTDDFSLQKIKLTDSQTGILILIDNFIKSLKNKSVENNFKSLKERIISFDTESPFYIKLPDSQEYPSTEITRQLELFIKNRQAISMKYGDRSKDLWNVKPLKIAFYDGFWYLLAEGMENKIIKYSINKIKEVKETGEIFEPVKDLNKILDDSTNVWFDKERPVNIKMHISKEAAKYFKSNKIFPMQNTEKENKDGSIDISCKGASDYEIIPAVLKWIPYIKITEPEYLAKKVKGIVCEYIEKL